MIFLDANVLATAYLDSGEKGSVAKAPGEL